MKRIEKQKLMRDSLAYTKEPKNIVEAYDYVLYHVLNYCIKNNKSLSSVSRTCGLSIGYFDTPTRTRDITLDTAHKLLALDGVLDSDADLYGIIGASYDTHVHNKVGMHDLPFVKDTIRKSMREGTELRLSSVVKYLVWLGIGFEDFFKYYE